MDFDVLVIFKSGSLKRCEPEFIVSTPKRLLELLSLNVVDISELSLMVTLILFLLFEIHAGSMQFNIFLSCLLYAIFVGYLTHLVGMLQVLYKNFR